MEDCRGFAAMTFCALTVDILEFGVDSFCKLRLEIAQTDVKIHEYHSSVLTWWRTAFLVRVFCLLYIHYNVNIKSSELY